MKDLLYIGLDVHKDSISIAVAESGRNEEVRSYGKISNTLHAVEKVTLQHALQMRGHFHNIGNDRAPSCPFLTLTRQKSSFSNNGSHSKFRHFVKKASIGQHFRISIWPTLAIRTESNLLRQAYEA